MTSVPEHAHLVETPGGSTRDHWKNTILAGLANYIDAGSIVAGSAALALWAKQFHLTTNFLGLIGAFSSNAISAGIGALIGGRLCDMAGRKKIYQWDMLVYAFGMSVLVFAVTPWMIVVGFVLVGLAVGADIPASWTIIAEMAPTGTAASTAASRRCCGTWAPASCWSPASRCRRWASSAPASSSPTWSSSRSAVGLPAPHEGIRGVDHREDERR